MPTEEEFEEAMEDVAEMTEAIGNEVVDRNRAEIVLSDETESADGINAHRCRHGDHFYGVATQIDQEYIDIFYPYSLRDLVGNSIPPEIAQEIVGAEPGGENDVRQRAAVELIDEVPRQEMEELKRRFAMVAMRGPTAINIDTTEQGSLDSFQAVEKIFPYDESFNVSLYHESVQRLINTGLRGQKLLEQMLTLNINEGRPAATILTVDFR